MRFGYTILYVEDVSRAIDFYERAFGLARRFVTDDATYGEMETGDTTLSFASHGLAESNLPEAFRRPEGAATAFEVCFVTEDVVGAYDRAVREGAEPVTPPQTKPWGQDVAYVQDPDGNLVELASPAR